MQGGVGVMLGFFQMLTGLLSLVCPPVAVPCVLHRRATISRTLVNRIACSVGRAQWPPMQGPSPARRAQQVSTRTKRSRGTVTSAGSFMLMWHFLVACAALLSGSYQASNFSLCVLCPINTVQPLPQTSFCTSCQPGLHTFPQQSRDTDAIDVTS